MPRLGITEELLSNGCTDPQTLPVLRHLWIIRNFLLSPYAATRSRGLACAPPGWFASTAGKGAILRGQRCTSNKDEHGPTAHYRSRITEPEKTTPVTRERALLGANPHPAATRGIDSHTREKRFTRSPQSAKFRQSESGALKLRSGIQQIFQQRSELALDRRIKNPQGLFDKAFIKKILLYVSFDHRIEILLIPAQRTGCPIDVYGAGQII